jgi:hypothetical protein
VVASNAKSAGGLAQEKVVSYQSSVISYQLSVVRKKLGTGGNLL